MPRKVVDLSARSQIIRDEPFHLHFWESSVDEALAFLKDPAIGGKSQVRIRDFALAVSQASEEE